LKARKFAPRVKNLEADKTWTETPQERMERLCGSAKRKEAPVEAETEEEDESSSEKTTANRDKALYQQIQEYNATHRSTSLMEQYQKEGRMEDAFAKQQEDYSKRKFDWKRDMSTMGNRASISEKDRKKMLEKMAQLGDRFSTGSKKGSFL
jgi:hypothetical protein